MKLNLRNPLCIFDLETTGTNISQDRIIEIAVVKLLPNGEVQRKHNLINPTIPIPPESTRFHRLRDEDVADKPTFKEVAKEYVRFLEGADLSGFNVLKFDIPVLVEEFLRAEVEFDYSKRKIVDVQRIFHLMEKRTLSAAYKFYLNKDLTNSHSAMADTDATMEVLMAQVEKYEGQEVIDGLNQSIGKIENDMDSLARLSSTDMVDLAGRMVLNDKGIEVFNFGKHKGKAVAQVFRDEPSYYDWMMNGDFSLDTKRKLTEIKLRSFKR